MEVPLNKGSGTGKDSIAVFFSILLDMVYGFF